MTGNDPYGQHQQRYDQYGRPLPQQPPQPQQPAPQYPEQYAQYYPQQYAQQQAEQAERERAEQAERERAERARAEQARHRQQSEPPAYPGGPLALPDETSIYVYGQTPDGYTRVTPAVPPPTPRSAGTVYRAGQPYGATAPERPLVWQELFSGLIARPLATLERARDQAFWWPALIVSALCGVLALVANDSARKDVVTSTLSTSVPALLITAVLVPAFLVVLGWVTNMLAATFGGNGEAGPLITLSMLVVWLADLPRLAIALFTADGNKAVVALGVATWAVTVWLLTALVERVHELPWPKALGAVSVQAIGVLLVLKLPLTG
ncbi:Yip1 family protein [Yinghuangia seranimata]|uniref:Yip1 family protein n=1 Tax=Yinghuangia seranimata TaxID=408067 RepID=UPI00248C7563|nr:Yip1 family protein [Yinghuangia seranimata]MDI2130817.1 Yip1 family protein [Yinghuangia seranimata]